ncbi:hypothetical protein L1987_63538 [Smallanthus sonchifolius]|uniref:Uncharacterized protein n=1 Tax=Smallanthus sonchifolius TaxID=185202 RepID=A0ACB9CDJ6_9ASTR|nr:hypothetical protein L1987_63538 [Smallanthus sonchifolius]
MYFFPSILLLYPSPFKPDPIDPKSTLLTRSINSEPHWYSSDSLLFVIGFSETLIRSFLSDVQVGVF